MDSALTLTPTSTLCIIRKIEIGNALSAIKKLSNFLSIISLYSLLKNQEERKLCQAKLPLQRKEKFY
jgi:hypothetical protein